MMQTEYDVNILYQEAQTRWLKPAEVYFILQNHERYQLTQKAPQNPTTGSLFLFNKRVVKYFRKDGHDWRRKKDGRAVAEAHERLKVGNVEALNCYYAHGEHDPNFQRRSYWMLDPANEHIVLVHYRDIRQGKQSSGHEVQTSPNSSNFIPSPSSNGTQNPSLSPYVTESSELRQHSLSPGSVEVSSETVLKNNRVDTPGDSTSSSDFEVKQALRRLEEQLSLGDDSFQEIDPSYSQNQNADDLHLLEYERGISEQAQLTTLHHRPENNKLERCYGGYVGAQYHSNNLMLVKNDSGGSRKCGDEESASWNDVLASIETSLGLTSEEKAPHFSETLQCKVPEDSGWHYGSHAHQSSLLLPQEFDAFKVPTYSSGVETRDRSGDYYFEQDQVSMPPAQDVSLTVAPTQKFTIQEISPEWGYASEITKVIIVGSFLCDPTESTWTCMFGDTEVPLHIIREGVLRCEAPSNLPGKVTLCVTSGNRVSCSEIREFEYRDKTSPSCARCNISKSPEASKSPGELLLLLRFVQMLLSGPAYNKQDYPDSGTCHLLVDAIRDGNGPSSSTVDWLLQELLEDKLNLWLSSRSKEENQLGCSLSKSEQGIIHTIAGLGFEWALHPILSHGVSVNFRDTKGWTALHWAARFGREKMVAALIASGASAGAVTDPNSQDPTGKTPASIAASSGHKGLAGYLSELALMTHLSSLTLEETENSKGSAKLHAEMTMNSISKPCHPTNEDRVSLKETLAAVRNAAQAAARIQAAFRAHSFRRRQQKEDEAVDEYGIHYGDIQGISAMSKLSFGSTRDYNSAALSIQKKYRGWKGRRDFLAFRQKVVKIQAHVRGYQVRKHYKVICWAVGILDKVVLRWRRKGAGLRGFRQEAESSDGSEDEDILKVFRKQKVDGAVNEAFSRVLSMVDSPDARQQYRRMLDRFHSVKAEFGGTSETSASADDTLVEDMFDIEKDDLYML